MAYWIKRVKTKKKNGKKLAGLKINTYLCNVNKKQQLKPRLQGYRGTKVMTKIYRIIKQI